MYKPVTSINITYNIALITILNLPDNTRLISELFTAIAKEDINIDMINQAPPFRNSINISFSLPSADLVKVLGVLNSFKKKATELRVEIDTDNTKLQVFGEGMRNIPGVAARLYTILANEGVDIKLVTTSEVDISYLIYEKDVDKSITAIKKEYNIC